MTYIELKTTQEILDVRKYIDAWKDKTIPEKQYNISVERELKKNWEEVAPFKALKQVVDFIPNDEKFDCIEIGASSGYNGQLLKRWDIKWDYTGLDYNPEFGVLSKKLWPDQKFVEGDALNLLYPDNSFDVVISGCCMLHIFDYKKAIQEVVRISKKYVIFHRHPLLWESETRFFMKEAYGIPCFEIWFGAHEFKQDMKDNGLNILQTVPVFERDTEYGKYGHYSILCQKK
jgi:SAM-dependent methyltransferase